MKKQVNIVWSVLTLIPASMLVGIRGKVSRALITIGLGLTLSQVSLATDYYATPSGAGSQDGSSWCNAFSQSQVENALDSSMQPGDVLHLGSGTYSQAIHIDSSGAAFTNKRLVGEDTGSGLPVIDMGNWSRTSPTSGAWSTLGQSSVAIGALSGLDVHVNDDDDGGNRDGKKAWFNTADTSWQNPGTFSTARLVGVCR